MPPLLHTTSNNGKRDNKTKREIFFSRIMTARWGTIWSCKQIESQNLEAMGHQARSLDKSCDKSMLHESELILIERDRYIYILLFLRLLYILSIWFSDYFIGMKL